MPKKLSKPVLCHIQKQTLKSIYFARSAHLPKRQMTYNNVLEVTECNKLVIVQRILLMNSKFKVSTLILQINHKHHHEIKLLFPIPKHLCQYTIQLVQRQLQFLCIRFKVFVLFLGVETLHLGHVHALINCICGVQLHVVYLKS